MFPDLWRDIRYGARMLIKQPTFALIAVLTLGLGIGATTAIFSVVYGVLINPYPYARADEIWVPGVVGVKTNQRMRPYPPAGYREMARLPGFSDVMATRPGGVLLTGEYAPENFGGIRVSGNAFQFLGVPPILGRTIQPSDIRPSGEPEPVVVLSYQRWQRLFGGDPNAIGKTLKLDDEVYTIIGVMPPRFGWWTEDGVWLPLGDILGDAQMVFPIVRLKPGATTTEAQQQLHALNLELARDTRARFPNEEFSTLLTNYLDITVASGAMQQSLQLLFGAAGFLLLIACANVANLQLARATSRAREIAVRMALGAGRGRLVRQLLTESLMVSLLGGLLGLAFAYWITQLIVALMPGNYVPNESRIEVNNQVLVFCLGVSMLTGIVFGLAPALQSLRVNLLERLKDEGRGLSGAAGGRVRAALVVGEVALAVVLLLGASLTARSFISLKTVELGFEPKGVMAVSLPLPPKRYATPEQRNRFAREVLERVSNTPGAVAATIGNGGLPFGGIDSSFAIEGRPDAEKEPIRIQAVAADYLRTAGIPLKRGRMLTEQEINAGARMAVINEAAAKLWPAGEDPIGRRIILKDLERPSQPGLFAPFGDSPEATVVGIIGNTRHELLRAEAPPALLVPYTLVDAPVRVLAVRSDGDPKLLLNALRSQVREIDSEQPVVNPITFEEILGFRTEQPRFTLVLFGLFAALGLGLALAGIYSVISYMVSMRTHEIGVRMALGAQASDVLRLILRAGGILVGVGLAAGLFAGLATMRLLGSWLNLYDVTTSDPLSYLAVAVLIGVVALAACFIPARRATRVDPMGALRCE